MNRIKWLFLISWIQWVYGSEQYGNGDYASEPNKYAQFKFWRSDNIDEARPELSEWKTNYDSDQHQEQSIRPIMPKSSLFPENKNAKGELEFDPYYYELIYLLYKDERWVNLFAIVEWRLYGLLSRDRQRELHALAQLFTNDFDIELFQLLKSGKFENVHEAIRQRLSRLPSAQKTKALEIFWRLFGRDLESCSVKGNHIFESQMIVVGIVFILW